MRTQSRADSCSSNAQVFFGSKEHKAKIRGFVIGQQFRGSQEIRRFRSILNATVIGLYAEKELVVRIGEEIHHYKGDAVLVATGAAENMVTFDGWTLPGVIGAGAAQTMMNAAWHSTREKEP